MFNHYVIKLMLSVNDNWKVILKNETEKDTNIFWGK